MSKIYLDNAATTQPLKNLNELCADYIYNEWYNPSGLYKPGVEARRRINKAEEKLLRAFGSDKHKCLFTSGGTESANTVILRGARISKNANFVCSGAEHPCVEECFKFLASQGHEVRYAKTDSFGITDTKECTELVDENTALVSVMHVNNETGAKNDISKIAAAVKSKNPRTLFHSDGVQAFLRENCDVSNIDYYTVSAHKVNGFKGTGAIFYKPEAPLKPYILGGGQQNGLRSGTENTLGIFAFEKVCDYYTVNKEKIQKNLKRLHDEFINAAKKCEDLKIITPFDNCCNHIISVSAPGIAGETILHILEEKGIYISTGSACSSKKGRSRIAAALGLSAEIAGGMLRISFSLHNTVDEVLRAADEINKAVKTLSRFKR